MVTYTSEYHTVGDVIRTATGERVRIVRNLGTRTQMRGFCYAWEVEPLH